MDDNSKVYLLKIVNDDKSLYKIGFTKGSVYKRIRELQTGCPYEIHMVDTYSSEYSSIIESSLHNMFSHLKTHGEWFELGCEEENRFKDLCKKYENIQITIKNK